MGAIACIVVGVIIVLLGIAAVLVGTLGVSYELPRQKNDYLVIDSADSPQYSNWAGGYDKQVEYDLIFYLFNLTNADDVRQYMAVPVYTTTGPYVYRRYRQSLNVSFPEGGNQVKYADYREYQFNQDKSNGSKYDYVVNVNPVYLAAMAQAGDEQHMLGGAAGGYFGNYTTYFTGEFISLYTSFVLPGYLQNITTAQINLIDETLHNTTLATDYFLDAWCNGTNTTIGNWTGLTLRAYSGNPTGISKTSAQMLFDPSLSLSLLNADNITSWAWDRSMVNTSYSNMITTAFNISFAQLTAIWYWRINFFGPTFIYEHTKAKYNLDTIFDLGWAQWSAGYDILGGTVEEPISIFNLFPTDEIGYYTTVELFLNPAYPLNFDWQDAKRVLNPTTGLGNITVYQDFALAMGNRTNATDFSKWGMNSAQAEQLYTYIFLASYEQVVPALQAVFGDSGGLILNQTVDDWVFNCNYFLINLLLPVPQPCSLLVNASNYNTALIWSGKNNISAISQYIDWNGSPVVSGVWADTIPVKGSTELGQFPPNQNNQTVLQTFDDELVRTVTLNYNSSVVVQQINTNRFLLDIKQIYAEDPLYFQTIPWFANMTSYKQAPIYFSMCDMLYVSETYRNKVIGLVNNATESEANCISFVDVEPSTGATLAVQKKIQVNMYIEGNCTWCNNSISVFNNFAVPQDLFLPFVKAGEASEITSALADQVRSKLSELDSVPRYGLIIGLSVGLFLVALGIIFTIVGFRRRSAPKGGYTDIGEYSLPAKRY